MLVEQLLLDAENEILLPRSIARIVDGVRLRHVVQLRHRFALQLGDVHGRVRVHGVVRRARNWQRRQEAGQGRRAPNAGCTPEDLEREQRQAGEWPWEGRAAGGVSTRGTALS